MVEAVSTLDARYLGGRLKKCKRALRRFKNRLKNYLLSIKDHILIRMIDLVNSVLMDAYKIPWSAAQNFAHEMARRIGNIALLLFQFPALSAYELTGTKWKIIFIGKTHRGLQQICRLFFDDKFDREELGKIPLRRVSSQSQKWLEEGIDLIVCELNCVHPKRPKAAISFTSPTLINQVIPIPKQLETALSGRKVAGIRRIVNRAKKLGFNYKFSQSPADFDNFHYNMYLPFIKSRHGDLATITPYEVQRRWFAKGGLLLVTQHGRPVAGALCCIGDHTCYSIELGILGACPKLFQQGVTTIINWYKITWAHELGASRYNMGSASARCSDPVFTYKRRWGARVEERKRIYATFTFLASQLSIPLQNHLNKLGFISELDGKFYRVFLDNDIGCGKQTDVSKELSATKKEGLDGLAVVLANSNPVIYDL